ncbi:MAG: TonB family protein [Dongiaceae bacterium]
MAHVQGPPTPKAGGDAKTGDAYLNGMRDRITRRLHYPLIAGVARPARPAIFTAAIDHGGQILDLKLKESSGQPLFDAAAEEAIRRAAPYPPPPFLPPNQVGVFVNIIVPPQD